MTFLMLQTFSLHHTPCPPTAYVSVLMLCTFSSHCTALCLYYRCDSPGDAFFFARTADVKFLILQTFSSNYRPCPPTADVALLMLYTLSSSHFTTFSLYNRCDTPHTAQPSLNTEDATVLVLHNFSLHTADVTFLILQTFSSHHTHCSPNADVALLMLYTFSSHCTALCLQMRPFHIPQFFSHCTADVTFLIMQTFSSHYTLSAPTADIAFLIVYKLSTHSTAFSLYCRFDPPGTAHFPFSYCQCDIPDTADFHLTPYTLLSYCRCRHSNIVHSLFTLHNLLSILQI